MAYRPERHYDEDYKTVPQCANNPFGMGKRQCMGLKIGENNAKMMAGILIRMFELKAETDE